MPLARPQDGPHRTRTEATPRLHRHAQERARAPMETTAHASPQTEREEARECVLRVGADGAGGSSVPFPMSCSATTLGRPQGPRSRQLHGPNAAANAPAWAQARALVVLSSSRLRGLGRLRGESGGLPRMATAETQRKHSAEGCGNTRRMQTQRQGCAALFCFKRRRARERPRCGNGEAHQPASRLPNTSYRHPAQIAASCPRCARPCARERCGTCNAIDVLEYPEARHGHPHTKSSLSWRTDPSPCIPKRMPLRGRTHLCFCMCSS